MSLVRLVVALLIANEPRLSRVARVRKYKRRRLVRKLRRHLLGLWWLIGYYGTVVALTRFKVKLRRQSMVYQIGLVVGVETRSLDVGLGVYMISIDFYLKDSSQGSLVDIGLKGK